MNRKQKQEQSPKDRRMIDIVLDGGGRWLIYLRWSGERGDEPWSAELLLCDKNWEHIPDSPDNVNLLEEKDHVPGTVKDYYYDEEYPFLMERVLEIVREMKPELKDQLI